MRAFVVFQESLYDQAKFDAYRKVVMPTLAAFEGKIIVRAVTFSPLLYLQSHALPASMGNRSFHKGKRTRPRAKSPQSLGTPQPTKLLAPCCFSGICSNLL
ncbi:hypothetical protein B5V02_12810 [Mesorhizobium kowhaii]|uniref:Uncharacterized protein n=1 Tax=Mesorhizobium kowhaii TaxID=1300272 RepID=A0A2W7C2Q3_9HYPH|nr:hypothetical protein B5V02_12810 [Mesorhizobium kowhaii]